MSELSELAGFAGDTRSDPLSPPQQQRASGVGGPPLPRLVPSGSWAGLLAIRCERCFTWKTVCGAMLDRRRFEACRVLIVGGSRVFTEPFLRFPSATWVQRWRITAT